jgi:ribosomal protein S27AE
VGNQKKNTVEHLVVIGKVDCWRCKSKDMTVCAPMIVHDGGVELLQNVTMMEQDLLLRMKELLPYYRFVSSKKTGLKYFANTCPSCGMFTGDTHLHGSRGIFGLYTFADSLKVVDTGIESDHVMFQEYKVNVRASILASDVYKNSERIQAEDLSGKQKAPVDCASCGDPMFIMDRFLGHNQPVYVCGICERTEAVNGYVLYPGSYFQFDTYEYPPESYAPEIQPRDDVPPPGIEP